MTVVDRRTQAWVLFFSSLCFLFGLHNVERCWRAGTWTFEMKGNVYAGGQAMFAIAAMVVAGGVFVVTSLRNLAR